ncbi:MAG: hypothetical protein K9H26_18385 [Prolixibacteraceae bacterium]|nr:hypothetical protein [Prolixibacteraceae bacterium]
MIIYKGDKAFSMLNIEPMELSNIFDAFQNNRHNLLELQKASDKELSKAMNYPQSKIKEARKIMKEKVEFYEKHLKKMISYEKK